MNGFFAGVAVGTVTVAVGIVGLALVVGPPSLAPPQAPLSTAPLLPDVADATLALMEQGVTENGPVDLVNGRAELPVAIARPSNVLTVPGAGSLPSADRNPRPRPELTVVPEAQTPQAPNALDIKSADGAPVITGVEDVRPERAVQSGLAADDVPLIEISPEQTIDVRKDTETGGATPDPAQTDNEPSAEISR